jgi:hypothetical protein
VSAESLWYVSGALTRRRGRALPGVLNLVDSDGVRVRSL